MCRLQAKWRNTPNVIRKNPIILFQILLTFAFLMFLLPNRLLPLISPISMIVFGQSDQENVELLLNPVERMLDMEEPAPALVDTGRAKALHAALQDYLDRYMPEAPEAHKWIILAYLFLALVAREPMHPKAIVGWEQAGCDYICPVREEGGVCQ